MPQFLFVVEVPPGPAMSSHSAHAREWTQFSSAAEAKIKTLKGTKQLQPNAWLLPADNSLPVLAELCALAGTCTLRYSSLLLPVDAVIIALNVEPPP